MVPLLGKTSSKLLEYGLIAIGVVLGVLFNNQGLIGWLPILSNLVYSISVFRFKDDEYSLKIAFTVCVAMYIAFSIKIQNYVGAASNILVFSTSLFSVLTYRRAAKQRNDLT